MVFSELRSRFFPKRSRGLAILALLAFFTPAAGAEEESAQEQPVVPSSSDNLQDQSSAQPSPDKPVPLPAPQQHGESIPQLKSFTPSEKIRSDTTVAFPADI